MLRTAVLAVDLALISGVGVLAWAQARPAAQPGGAAARVAPAAEPDRARAAAKALERLASDPEALVADASRAEVGDDARDAVPAGSRVDADPGSWAPDDTGGGVLRVTVRPPGARATTYAAVMVEEPDGWKVLATFPVER